MVGKNPALLELDIQTLNVEAIHLRADFEALRAKTMNELSSVMPTLRDVTRALERPTLTDEKRLMLAEVLAQRLDVVQDVIDKLAAAKR
jgi:hypothetical protein